MLHVHLTMSFITCYEQINESVAQIMLRIVIICFSYNINNFVTQFSTIDKKYNFRL